MFFSAVTSNDTTTLVTKSAFGKVKPVQLPSDYDDGETANGSERSITTEKSLMENEEYGMTLLCPLCSNV